MTIMPGRDDLHTRRYRPAAHRAYNPGPGGNDDKQECAPGFGVKSSPFMGGFQKICGCCGMEHTLLRRRSSLLRPRGCHN